MRRFYSILCLICLYCVSSVQAQQCEFPPSLTFDQVVLNGISGLTASFEPTLQPDGGVLIVGGMDFESKWYEVRDYHYTLIKYDESANEQWRKVYGTEGFNDIATSLLTLPDGNLLIGGHSYGGATGDKSEASRGSYDYWVIKIDTLGNKLWDKTYGGSGLDKLGKMLLLDDGSVLLIGDSDSGISGDKTAPRISSELEKDLWIVKIDTLGNKIWDKAYGNIRDNVLAESVLLSDGSILLGGSSALLIKIDSSGNKLWQKNFAGGGNVRSIVEYPSGDLLLGITSSDYRILKTDAQGRITWERNAGGSGSERFFKLHLLPNGNIISGGRSYSKPSGDKSQSNRDIYGSYWLIEIDEQRNKVWDLTLDGGEMTGFLIDENGDYILTGTRDEPSFGCCPAKRGWANITRLDKDGFGPPMRIYLLDEYGRRVRQLNDGDQIDLNDFDTELFNFELVTDDPTEHVRSLVLDLKGPVSIQRIENLEPYNLTNTVLEQGRYTFSATPFCDNDAQGTPGETVQISFQIVNTPPAFTLVDANTEQDIQRIFEGDLISFDAIGTSYLSIRYALQTDQEPDSVKMSLSGRSLNHQQTERLAPYALFGGEPASNYFGASFCPGNYSIETIEYLNGQVISSSTINFELVGDANLDITNLTLVDAQNNEDISPLSSEIYTNQEGYSIRADAGNCAKSVRFVLEDTSGQILIDQVENIKPFALLGDSPRGDYNAWFPNAGLYTLTVTAHSETKASGVAGVSMVMNIEVLESQISSMAPSLIQAYPNPSTNNSFVHMTFHVQWTGKAVLTVMDKQGLVQLQKDIDHKEIDLDISGLKSGFYFVNVRTDLGSYITTLIKN